MKKHVLFASLVLSIATLASVEARWGQPLLFEDVFQASERIMREAQQNSERIMREAQQHFAQVERVTKECQENLSTQPDYTLQSQRDETKGVYRLSITLNGKFRQEPPKVSVSDTKDASGALTKELEVEATSTPNKKTDQNRVNDGERTCFTQSLTTVIRNGKTEQIFEGSQASVKNGILSIKYSLPRDINEKNYTMEFADGQLKLEFPITKLAKTALVYTPNAKKTEEEDQEK
ncbi:hypothetical protein FJ365_03885 [Candidatus Dependentiae bacterium]|nr:hypothetical protein [Candidatus Dependentiae bacterium]